MFDLKKIVEKNRLNAFKHFVEVIKNKIPKQFKLMEISILI